MNYIFNSINISLSEAFFHKKDLTLLTFLAFWLNCRVVIAPKPNKIWVLEPFLYNFDALAWGQGRFWTGEAN